MNATQMGLGETLRTRRRQKNLSLEFIAQETRIQQRFLNALEEEKWDEFPARVYLEGFLRKYATVLGLEANEMVHLYQASPGVKDKPLPLQRPRNEGSPSSDESPSVRPAVFFFLVLGLLFAGTYLYRTSVRRTPPAPLTLSRPETPSVGSAKPAKTGSGLHEFEIRCKETVWIRALVDDRIRFEGIVRAGMSKIWPGNSRFRVIAADASSVDVLVDGENLPSSQAHLAGEIQWPSPFRASGVRPVSQTAGTSSPSPGALSPPAADFNGHGAPPAAPAKAAMPAVRTNPAKKSGEEIFRDGVPSALDQPRNGTAPLPANGADAAIRTRREVPAGKVANPARDANGEKPREEVPPAAPKP